MAKGKSIIELPSGEGWSTVTRDIDTDVLEPQSSTFDYYPPGGPPRRVTVTIDLDEIPEEEQS